MLDNYGANIERLVRLQNANVSKTAYPQKVKDDFDRDRERNSDSFEGELKKAKGKIKKSVIQVDATKQSIGGEIVVDSSLSEKINEHRVISQLVTEKFVNNPDLQGKIEFEETPPVKNKIDKLLSDDEEFVKEVEVTPEPEPQSASEACLHEIEKVMKKLEES